MAGMIPAGSRFLDVGCGEGTLGEALSRARRAEFVGVEPDAARAARARARGLNAVVDYFCPQVVRAIGPVDVVVLAVGVEHLPDPQSMRLVCVEALKPVAAVI